MTPENDKVVSSQELLLEMRDEPLRPTVSSGYAGLDELLGGFGPGQMTVISGEPGMGKTTLCISLTKRFSQKGAPVLWFSVEMPYKEFFSLFGEALPLFYVPRYRDNRTVDWMEKKIKEAKEQYGVKFVFIDHLGLIRDEATMYQKNSIDIIDARLERIHQMAIDYDVHIIGTSEHNKESMKGKSEMHLENLRGTARLAYTANNVIGIERLTGIKKIRTWQEVEPDEVFVRTDMWITILKSRTTGARKIRIAAYMDENGDIKEYDRGEILPSLD